MPTFTNNTLIYPISSRNSPIRYLHEERYITELSIFVDDFCKAIDAWLKNKLLAGEEHRNPTIMLKIWLSEIMTIELLCQQSPCRNFKYFYRSYLSLQKRFFYFAFI
ncbi:hypothetical protein MIDIC_50039 [Alphaproteobacteria bacterium]